MSLLGVLFGGGGWNAASASGAAKPGSPSPSSPSTQPSGVSEPQDANASSGSGKQESAFRQGTPSDAPAVKLDFSTGSAAAGAIEDSAPAFALAAQTTERMPSLVAGIGTAARAPAPETADTDRETGAPVESTYGRTLQTLRGQSAPVGALLDKAA